MRHWILPFLLFPLLVHAAGSIHTVEYPPSDQSGELIYGVTYRLWIPDGVAKLRGVIVHQHGCGTGACKGGATAADDLHWQALAKKWDCALLGPTYHQVDGQDCRKWCDPRNGSDKTFLRCLADFAKESGHAELEQVPWCLWGHSGGGYWSSVMQALHPERIVAIWLRSGTAFETWEKGEVPKPEITAAVYGVPVMCNPGLKEKGDKRFNGAFTGTRAMFAAYRAKGAPIGFAPDPRTAHETGDARYLAIPFFDACLAMRLPDKGSNGPLKPVDFSKAWLAALETDSAQPAASYAGDAKAAVWLPNEAVAKDWMEYVKTGEVGDTTPPPAPSHVIAKASAGTGVELTWDAEADFESGLQGFVIERDGKEIARLPEKPNTRFGRAVFQGKSHGDTPEPPVAQMRFEDTHAAGGKAVYSVRSINSVGLQSEPTAAKNTP